MQKLNLPPSWRGLDRAGRLKLIEGLYGADALHTDPTLADIMIENALGFASIPLGLASGFLIDGQTYHIPLATEEPSVIAAASFAGRFVAQNGGFTTNAARPLMMSHLFITNANAGGRARLESGLDQVRQVLENVFASMQKRGGGLKGLLVSALPDTDIVKLEIHAEVQDSMGANLLNTAAEAVRGIAGELSGGQVLMGIVSNASFRRLASAAFSIPLARLLQGSWRGRELAERIVLASTIAAQDGTRAVTHNKGIMNGISALALATGNDTRALEAAVHAYAAEGGTYRGLGSYSIENDCLAGQLTLPIPLATVGGSVGLVKSAQTCLKILGNPDAALFSRLAVSLGLAQNLAALLALVTEGIQKGHMKLHRKKGTRA